MMFDTEHKTALLKLAHEFSRLSSKFNWGFIHQLGKEGENNFALQNGYDEFSYWCDGTLDIRHLRDPFPSGHEGQRPDLCFRVLRPSVLAGFFMRIENIICKTCNSAELAFTLQREIIYEASDYLRARIDGPFQAMRPEFFEALLLALSLKCSRALKDEAFFASRQPLTRSFCDVNEFEENRRYLFTFERFMNPAIMTNISTEIIAKGIALLPGFSPKFHPDGNCGLLKHNAGVCYGILWELPETFELSEFKTLSPELKNCHVQEMQVHIENKVINAFTLNFRCQTNIGKLSDRNTTLHHMTEAVMFFHGHPDWLEQLLFLSEIEPEFSEDRILN